MALDLSVYLDRSLRGGTHPARDRQSGTATALPRPRGVRIPRGSFSPGAALRRFLLAACQRGSRWSSSPSRLGPHAPTREGDVPSYPLSHVRVLDREVES